MRFFFPMLLLLFAGGHCAQAQNFALTSENVEARVLRLTDDGRIACDHAQPEEIEPITAGKQLDMTLTDVYSTSDPDALSGLRIVLRVSDRLLAHPKALLAFRRAAATWERHITTPMTIALTVDFGPDRFGSSFRPGLLGVARVSYHGRNGSGFIALGIDSLITQLKAQHQNDSQLLALYEALPDTIRLLEDADSNSVRNKTGFIAPWAVMQALDVYERNRASPPSVSTIGINSKWAWDFDPLDGIEAGKHDFEGIATHEIGHALGFTSAVTGGSRGSLLPWDLFRVRPGTVDPNDLRTFTEAVRVGYEGPASTDTLTIENDLAYFKGTQVFFDGLVERELATGVDGQASHWRYGAYRPPSLGAQRNIGVMDPYSGTGERSVLTNDDLRMLEVIGYNVAYDVPGAQVEIARNGTALNQHSFIETVDLGDAALGAAPSYQFNIRNTHTAHNLEIRSTVQMHNAVSSEIQVEVSPQTATVSPGFDQPLTLTISSTPAAGVFEGRLRIETSDENHRVVEIPFRFSVGGVQAPTLVLSTTDLGYLGDVTAGQPLTHTLELSNAGTQSLNYEARFGVLLTHQNTFPVPGKHATSTWPADLVFGASTPKRILYETDFETDWGGFTAADPDSILWQRTQDDHASLSGHSLPTAVQFVGGKDYNSRLVSPPIELEQIRTGELLFLGFNYISQGVDHITNLYPSDMISVQISFDGGVTYNKIARNGSGLESSRSTWHTAMFHIPIPVERSHPPQIAFQYQSDIYSPDFYIDDIQLLALDGALPLQFSPQKGELAGGQAQSLTFDIKAGTLAPGYYQGQFVLHTNDTAQRAVTIPFAFSVTLPSAPRLAVAPASLNIAATAGEQVETEISLQNTSPAPLSFVRLLEPALSNFATPYDGPVETVAYTRDDILASALLPGRFYGIGMTQLPDGRILIADFLNKGQTAVLNEQLELIEIAPGLSGELPTYGVAFNSATQSLWFALPDSVYEAVLEDGQLVSTGRGSSVSAPTRMTYSEALNAFIAPRDGLIYAFDHDGVMLSGYPFPVQTRIRSISTYGGIIEGYVGRATLGQLDQMGNFFPSAKKMNLSGVKKDSFDTLGTLLRDRTKPNERMYVVMTKRGAPGQWRTEVVAIDPPDLPRAWRSPIKARSPVYGVEMPENAEAGIALVFDAEHLEAGTYEEPLAFLTNNPAQPIVRVPTTFSVQAGPVAIEPSSGDIPVRFALAQNYPNPLAASTAIGFHLPQPEQVVIKVFDVTGREVETLVDEFYQAGQYQTSWKADNLADGVYLYRMQTGHYVASRKLIVLR